MLVWPVHLSMHKGQIIELDFKLKSFTSHWNRTKTWSWKWYFYFPVEYRSVQNSRAVKKMQPYAKWLVCEKLWCTGGSQEIAVMVAQWQNNLITTIQVNFYCGIPASLEIIIKFTWIAAMKIFVTDLSSQPFLGHHLYFTTFFALAILHRAAPFL